MKLVVESVEVMAKAEVEAEVKVEKKKEKKLTGRGRIGRSSPGGTG